VSGAEGGPGGRARVYGVGAVLALGAAVGLAVLMSARPPEGPVAVDWDGTRCARCGMLVSDPAFAGQLHRSDGAVRHYDDPGCLLDDLDEMELSEVHAVWLHHHRESRWIRLEDAVFARVPHSPMGYGLAALEGGKEEGFGLERVRPRVLERDEAPAAEARR